ncbi:MAG TPA: aminoglycoside phosphotransferase family protein [Pseudonocardiaceae bacterium]|nr:aminoglycoside phosphotransferase family protein [Pseudonocardiaceae bacterium]
MSPDRNSSDHGRNEVARWWPLLRFGEPVDVHTITSGASGAAVYQLDVGGRTAVLKVAAGSAARDRAARELRCYRELALPVRVPTLLGRVEQPDGICLLLESADIPPNAARWPNNRWTGLATELGRPHRGPSADWLTTARRPTTTEITAAARDWRRLGHGPRVTTMWSALDDMDAALARLPTCPVHGDWYFGNLLVDSSDRFVCHCSRHPGRHGPAAGHGRRRTAAAAPVLADLICSGRRNRPAPACRVDWSRRSTHGSLGVTSDNHKPGHDLLPLP